MDFLKLHAQSSNDYYKCQELLQYLTKATHDLQ